MEEFRKQVMFLVIFLVLITLFVVVYKSDIFWNLTKGLPLHSNSGKCIRFSDEICLAEDTGLRLGYYEASSLCSKRGMTLPSREQAWVIWINSENCHRIFASNLVVPKDKQSFISACKEENCQDQSINVKKYCTKNSKIKFPIATQYEKGYFWLRDNATDNKHFAINYSTGKIKAFDNNVKTLGARCVSR